MCRWSALLDAAVAVEWSCIICDGALHSESTAGTNGEGHGGLAGRGRLAEREGFEPSVEVSPYGSLANCCLRPLGHLSTGLSYVRVSHSSTLQVDDHRKACKRAVIIPQARWVVQAIHTIGQEKLSEEEDGKWSRARLLCPRKHDRFFRELDKGER